MFIMATIVNNNNNSNTRNQNNRKHDNNNNNKHRTHSSVMVRVTDCLASDAGPTPGQVSEFFVNFILLNSSN